MGRRRRGAHHFLRRVHSLFEFAETELFREVGLQYGVMFDELKIWLPRVHLECDFRRAARLDDLLEVSVFVGASERSRCDRISKCGAKVKTS